jgi:hypothetical protein
MISVASLRSHPTRELPQEFDAIAGTPVSVIQLGRGFSYCREARMDTNDELTDRDLFASLIFLGYVLRAGQVTDMTNEANSLGQADCGPAW